MTKILYAVQGEGMGHAIRSKVIIDYLIKKKHEVIIIAPDRAYDFLSKHFKDVRLQLFLALFIRIESDNILLLLPWKRNAKKSSDFYHPFF